MATPTSGAKEPDRQAFAAAEQEIREHVQHLHDKGVIDLNAPAKEVINALDREFPRATKDSADARAAAAQDGYWLVGDRGWCNHL